MKLLVILILKWAHTASSFARLNFGDWSKLGGTRENWPKIGQNLKFPMGKWDFQKIFKMLGFLPVCSIFMKNGMKLGLGDTKKVIGLHFCIVSKNRHFGANFGQK